MPTPPEHHPKIHNRSIPKTKKKASPATSPTASTPFASARSLITVTSSYASWAGAAARPFGSSKTFSPRSFLHPHPHPTNHLKAIHSAEKKYAMKVLRAECCGTGSDNFELEILQSSNIGEAEIEITLATNTYPFSTTYSYIKVQMETIYV
jgi:hypothetical protein